MNEMVERVARRLAAAHYGRRQHRGACTKEARVASLVDSYWRQFAPDARDAIDAMRDSTEAMEEAADAASADTFGNTHERLNPAATWEAMIDAALKP